MNTSRNLTRQHLVHVGADGLSESYRTTAYPDAADAEAVAFHHRTVRRVIGYVHALRHHLRSLERLAELEPFLPVPELEALNSLPLGAITNTIEINLRQRLGDAALPPPAQPIKNVLT